MNKFSDNTELQVSIILLVIALILVFLLGSCSNMMSADEWNNGFCPRCQVRYELRSVSHRSGYHYYSCPKCGNEIARWKLFD